MFRVARRAVALGVFTMCLVLGLVTSGASGQAVRTNACSKMDSVSFAHVASPAFSPYYFIDGSSYCLDLKDNILSASPTILQGVASGQFNVGYVPGGAIMQAISQGLDLKMLWPVEAGRKTSNGIFVKADGPIRSLQDLEGKTIGLLGLNSDIQAGVIERLGRAKVDVSKVKLIQYPFPQMLNGILTGRIDGGHLAEPFVTIGGNQVRSLFSWFEVWGQHVPIVYLVANGKWANENPDVVQRFSQAYARGILAALREPAKVREYAMKQDPNLSPELAGKIILPAYTLNYGISALNARVQRMSKLGLIASKPDPTKYFIRTTATAKDDVLNGIDGRDRLNGLAGNDILLGYAAPDSLNGGPGNDTIEAGPGRDSVVGGPGNDVISAFDGRRDNVDCGPGKDTAYADKVDKVVGCETVRRNAPTSLLVSLGVVIKD